jgi:DNA mismatch repair protein MutL
VLGFACAIIHLGRLPILFTEARIFPGNHTFALLLKKRKKDQSMPDIIRLLPDSVANQIAAGEVVQRPASAVKELLENAVDADADTIKLIVKDSGKTLIQVIDNGSGMSATDARLSFERHATSKIRTADDLFSITTKGFRGEALASIAAIAQVEMKTRKTADELGTSILIEGGELKSQEECSTSAGTSISIRNLFYNVPARRNFLKSEAVEFRHIIDEFERVALAHPDLAFSLHHNSTEVFNLPKANLKQRIVGLFGNPYNLRLAPLEEHTNILVLGGFIGKPEFAKRSRGEQFFFLNRRFIRNSYLNHAVQSAYSELLPKDSFPSYFIFLEVAPNTIDVNIHPTKTEVKFEDERSIYAMLRSAVKKSLGQYNISPSLDFNQEMGIELPLNPERGFARQPGITVDKTFNPFDNDKTRPDPSKKDYLRDIDWEKNQSRHAYNQLELLKPQEEKTDPGSPNETEPGQHTFNTEWDKESNAEGKRSTYQLHNRYILAHIKSGFIVIDQQGAHERILYERFLENLKIHKGLSQKKLFPESMELSGGDMVYVKALQEDLNTLGFDLSEFGTNTIAIHAVPVELMHTDAAKVIEGLLEEYKNHQSEFRLNQQDSIAKIMARKGSVKSGKALSGEEMNRIVDELFACKMPYSTPDGKPAVLTYTLDDLDRRFKK